MTRDKPVTTLRLDWTLAALSAWLVGGFYVDLWAHSHGRVDDTFFTPWHALLYLGAASFVVVLGAVAVVGKPRGIPMRDVLPGPYRMSFLGGLLFGVAGVLDLAWHTVFGFEVNVEALLSPTHLLLAASGLLMIGGPLRSASARLADAGAGVRSWRLAVPFVIPLAMASAILIAFTQYVNPIVDAWSSAEESAVEPMAQIYAMTPDGSRQTRLTRIDLDARGARLSPDGSTIVYSLAGGDDNPGQIHAMQADGGGDRTLTTEGANFDPAWSPDGSQVAFSGNRGGEPDVFVMQADGTGVRQLTDDPASDWGPAWSPDGTAIAFISNRSGTFDIYRIAVGGGEPTPVTSGPADDYDPAWAPDGARIAFTSNRGGDYGIWLIGALVAFLVPALFFAAYFAAVALTTGIGWSIHLWLGAIVIAGVIGLFLDELAHASAGARAGTVSEVPPEAD